MACVSVDFYSKAESSDEIHFLTNGDFLEKNGRFFLQYNDPSEGMNNIKTSILIDPKSEYVTFKRPDPLKSSITVSKNDRRTAEHTTPAGLISLETESEQLIIHITETGCSLDLKYTLYYINKPLETISIKIKVLNKEK